MPFTITVHHRSGYLLVRASGAALLADLYGFIDLVATIATNLGERCAVMDLTDVEIVLGFTQHLQLGVYAADRLTYLKRVASIVSEKKRTGTSEKAAQQMGLQLKTFTALQEGLKWIAE